MNQSGVCHRAHDLGGQRGFGLIDRSQTQLFADAWEQKVFGMTLACGMLGAWNLDQSRFAREQMPPQHYLASSYYEHWLHGLEQLLVQCGLLTAAELRSGCAAGKTPRQAITARQAMQILEQGAPTERAASTAPLFAVGARVRVRTTSPAPASAMPTHTRAPRYAQRREGVIVKHHGAHIFPDQHAARGEQNPQHLYSVRFAAHALWNHSTVAQSESASESASKSKPRAEINAAVYVDLFEPYLETPHGAT